MRNRWSMQILTLTRTTRKRTLTIILISSQLLFITIVAVTTYSSRLKFFYWNFRSNIYVAAYIIFKEFSSFSNSQRFSFSFHMLSLLSWLSSMIELILFKFFRSEDFETIIILLKTKWSDMIKRVSVSWLKHVIKKIMNFVKDLLSQEKDLNSTRISLENKWSHLTRYIEISWLQRVTKVTAENFVKCHYAQEKNLKSIRMLLKKQWSHLSDCFKFSWLKHLTDRVVVVDSDSASINLNNLRQIHNNLKAKRQLSQLAKFIKHHFFKEKDLKEIRMLLQKKWSHLTDFFEWSWLKHLTEKLVVINNDTVSNQCWRCELEIKVSSVTKCCKHFTQESERWD